MSVKGIDLFFSAYGDGPPLVLLHGFFASSRLWRPFIDLLAPHYRLIVPDLRGHGRSTNPARVFTHHQAAEDVFAVLDLLGIDRFQAMGDSTGGMTLLHMATQRRERIEAMVLTGATTYFTEVTRSLIGEFTFEGLDPDYLAELRAQHVRGDEQIRSLIDQFHGFRQSYDDMNFTPPYLSTITARTLVVHGDRDQYFPVSIPLEMYRSIPRSYLWILPNRTHAVLPEAFGATQTGRKLFIDTTLGFLRGDWE